MNKNYAILNRLYTVMKTTAEDIANAFGLHKSIEYDMYYREYDDKVEILGLVPDPTYSLSDFVDREYLFPNKWVTLGVFDLDQEIPNKK